MGELILNIAAMSKNLLIASLLLQPELNTKEFQAYFAGFVCKYPRVASVLLQVLASMI